jgi:hypothetical protein
MTEMTQQQSRVVAGLLCVGLAMAGSHAQAQEPRSTSAAPAPRNAIALKVEVTLSRYQGSKKISSMPYQLIVDALWNANPNVSGQPAGMSASLRMGVNVWTGRTAMRVDGSTPVSNPEYSYIGTDIDCRADYSENGYRVWLNVSDSSLMPPATGDATPPAMGIIQNSAVRRFVVSDLLRVRDGVPMQFSVGTDPISGDTVRAEVIVTAMK